VCTRSSCKPDWVLSRKTVAYGGSYLRKIEAKGDENAYAGAAGTEDKDHCGISMMLDAAASSDLIDDRREAFGTKIDDAGIRLLTKGEPDAEAALAVKTEPDTGSDGDSELRADAPSIGEKRAREQQPEAPRGSSISEKVLHRPDEEVNAALEGKKLAKLEKVCL